MPLTVRFHELGGPEVLKLEEEPQREPGEGEIRIRVRAIGLNRAEQMFRTGDYIEQPQFPAGLGYEAAGVVDKPGKGVRGFPSGTRVAVVPSFSMTKYPMYAQEVLAPAHAVVAMPDNLGFAEAAASWMQYITSWGALIHIARVKPGDVVLIPAATSSVGLAAIQIVRAAGGRPIALTRTSAKREPLLAAAPGVDIVFTEEQDLVEEVDRLTEGKWARIAFDPVGGKGVVNLAKCLAKGGTLFQYGALSMDFSPPFPIFQIIPKGLSMTGFTTYEITDNPKRLEAAKKYITRALGSGELKPVIARRFALEDIVEAHRYMESNRQVGKIVVDVG